MNNEELKTSLELSLLKEYSNLCAMLSKMFPMMNEINKKMIHIDKIQTRLNKLVKAKL